MRAYQEINDFEGQLARAGIIVVKFWLAISADEQLARLKIARRGEPALQDHADDWRNREKCRSTRSHQRDDRPHQRPRRAWTLVEATTRNSRG